MPRSFLLTVGRSIASSRSARRSRDAAAMARVPQHLVGELGLGTVYSAGRFARQANERIRDILGPRSPAPLSLEARRSTCMHCSMACPLLRKPTRMFAGNLKSNWPATERNRYLRSSASSTRIRPRKWMRPRRPE